MIVKIKFFTYFRDLFGGKEQILDLGAGTTAVRLLELLGDTPARRAELFDPASPDLGLKPHLIVLINGASLFSGHGLTTELRDGDVVAIFPLMGGG